MNVLAPQTFPRLSPAPARADTRCDRPKVAVVLTRSIADDSGVGRVNVLREIRKALNEDFAVTELRLHSLVETRRIRDLLTAGARLLLGLLSGRPLPLQTLLYSGAGEIGALIDTLEAGQFAAVYLDTVRCQLLIRAIRRRLPAARLVVDMDDLMSRRMEQLATRRLPLSLGFLRHLFPKPLQWAAQSRVSGLIARYEAAALSNAELETTRSADAIVLVSSAERDLLRHRVAADARQKVHAVTPPAGTCHDVPALARPLRFTFIGSDRLVQNRLAIDFLLRLWTELQPAAGLHIYGRQERPPSRQDNVTWHGFVDDVAEAYTSGSILLLPCLLPGGIKTKVIEAWAYGCPVLGNPLAFEGIEVPGYPLALQETEWANHVLHPEEFSSVWISAAQLGNDFVRGALSCERYAAQWRSIVAPAPGISQPHEV